MIQTTVQRYHRPMPVQLRMYSKKEIANFYGISSQTLLRRLKHNEKLKIKLMNTGYNKHKNILSASQVRIIFEEYGWPERKPMM